MNTTTHIKTGVLGGVSMLILGLSIFLVSSMVGTSTQPACVAGVSDCDDTPQTSIFQPYADLWLKRLAPECVGGSGPDSCIGPNLGIMTISLFVLGFLVGVGIGKYRGRVKRLPAPPKQ